MSLIVMLLSMLIMSSKRKINNMNLVILSLLNMCDQRSTSPVDRFIIQYVCEHPYEVSKMSIDELAHRLNISLSQVSRFVRHAGFESFKQFKQVLTYHGHKQRHTSIQNGDVDFKQYPYLVKEEMDYFFNHIDYQSIDLFVNDLVSFQNVALFGILNSENAAKDLQYNLARLSKMCVSLYDYKDQIEFIKQAQSHQLIVIYSMSGDYVLDNSYSRDYGLFSAMHQTQAKIYVITQQTDVQDLPFIHGVIKVPTRHHLYHHCLQYVNDLIYLKYQEISKMRK